MKVVSIPLHLEDQWLLNAVIDHLIHALPKQDTEKMPVKWNKQGEDISRHTQYKVDIGMENKKVN